MSITTQTWHREFKKIPKVTLKAPCYRLWVDSEGKIDSATTLSENIAEGIRKYGDNQSTFPAFNVVPLYRLTDSSHIEMLKKMIDGDMKLDIDLIKTWCTADNWYSNTEKLPDIGKKTYACAVTRGNKLERIFDQGETKVPGSLDALFQAIKPWAANDNGFRLALEECVVRRLSNADHPELYLQILFHVGDAAKMHKNDRGNLSVILDVRDWESFGYPVADERTTELINRALLQATLDSADRQDVNRAEDAFGSDHSDVGEPMPSVRLKGFDVTLRAMFNAQTCQYRYGKIDDASYPISRENRSSAQSALGWIADAKHQGITWQTIDKDEIVFAYPSILPEIPPALASLFIQTRRDSEDAEARFAEISGRMITSLRGLPPEETPENIYVFCLRKMDRARTKVVFNRNCSAQWFIHAAEEWQRGCTNLPRIDIWAFEASGKRKPGEKSSPALQEAITPFPLQVPGIVNNVWKQNGEPAQGKSAAKRMQYYQGMELLLDPADEATAIYYLHILLSHAIGLFHHMGNQQHKNFAITNSCAREVLMLLSTMGLLLYKCGCKKEDYMKSPAYLTGQLLKISDELHALYCKNMRNGDVPPQLAGNSVFVAASEMPSQALGQLCTRMNPYISWAKQYRTKNAPDSWKACWYLRLYEDVANQLIGIGNDRLDDLQKAQLFIGYLAAFPKRADDAGERETTEKENDL